MAVYVLMWSVCVRLWTCIVLSSSNLALWAYCVHMLCVCVCVCVCVCLCIFVCVCVCVSMPSYNVLGVCHAARWC